MKLGLFAATVAASVLLLVGCENGQRASNDDETKKSLDQLVQNSKDLTGQVRDIGNTSKANADTLKALTGKLDDLHRDLATALAKQKRGAISLTLDVETPCENDQQCAATARAVCNKINYPNAIASRFTPGVRPVLNSLICFD